MAHIERNWGDSFPTGWVWAQASAPFGEAFLVLTGGRFVIGPITTDSHVIGLRTRGGGGGGGRGGRGGMRRRNRDGAQSLSWDFRTTDLDRIVERRDACGGGLVLNATSRDRQRRLELHFSAPPASFGEPIPVPTVSEGFSARPGCRESYTAVVEIAAWQRQELVFTRRVPRAVLEFGGEFQC